MAINVQFFWKGSAVRDGREFTRDAEIIVTGVPVTDDAVADTTAAKVAAYGAVDDYWIEPGTGLTIPRVGLNLEDQGGGVFTGTVHYSTLNFTVFPPTSGQQEFGFEIGSTTARIKQSIATATPIKNSAVYSGSAPSFGGAINVQKTGGHTHVEGTDYEVTTSEFTVTWYFLTSVINDEFVQNIEAVCNCVNAATFRGRAAGSVRFRGATGYARTGSAVTPVTFRFAVSKNIVAATIGPFSGVNATGWQYIWTHFVEKQDMSANDIVALPGAMYVETLYKSANFSALGIGT